ncbi:DUF1918 domain-containing protein [Streptomyces sp. NPDC001443]
MRAHLGDQLVVESTKPGTARRDGEIVGLHHTDGTPPYEVRWSDTDEVVLVFPGPDAHIHRPEHGERGTAHGAADSGTSAAETGATVAALLSDPTAGVPAPGDIGRRVAVERRRQGLAVEEAARRARMSPRYLSYLEEHPADPTTAALVRLADALGTTAAVLRGGGVDRPPGQSHALLHPLIEDLDPGECRALLSTHGVGRVALSAPDGRPAVVPVNYEVVDDVIAFRTAPGSLPATAVGAEVAFEVDHVDDFLSQGWSVLAVGPASEVMDPDVVRGLTERAHTTPWAGGGRGMWVMIRPTSLTGRRITAADR